jgi:hypothetical protein
LPLQIGVSKLLPAATITAGTHIAAASFLLMGAIASIQACRRAG